MISTWFRTTKSNLLSTWFSATKCTLWFLLGSAPLSAFCDFFLVQHHSVHSVISTRFSCTKCTLCFPFGRRWYKDDLDLSYQICFIPFRCILNISYLFSSFVSLVFYAVVQNISRVRMKPTLKCELLALVRGSQVIAPWRPEPCRPQSRLTNYFGITFWEGLSTTYWMSWDDRNI